MRNALNVFSLEIGGAAGGGGSGGGGLPAALANLESVEVLLLQEETIEPMFNKLAKNRKTYRTHFVIHREEMGAQRKSPVSSSNGKLIVDVAVPAMLPVPEFGGTQFQERHLRRR